MSVVINVYWQEGNITSAGPFGSGDGGILEWAEPDAFTLRPDS